MPGSVPTDRDRRLSAAAICLCTVAVGVSATALESSLSTGIAPNPPDTSPDPGLSLQALLYLLLQWILSVFGISLDQSGTMRSTGGSILQPMILFIQLLYRHRLFLLAGVVVITVLGLGFRHRNRIGSTKMRASADTPAHQPRTQDDWLCATPSDPVARAWIEMVRTLDIDDPHSRTLGEWETAAIETGFDPVAVRTITQTFAEVQYGTADVTPKRRTRVQQALTELPGERNDR